MDTVSKLADRIKGIGTAASDSAGKTGLLDKALGAIFSPTGLIAGATVGALAGSIWAIYDSVQATVQPAWDLADAFANSAPSLEKYNEYIGGAKSALEGFNIEQTSTGELLKTYDEQIGTSIDNIHSIVNSAASQSREFTEGEYAQIQELIGMVDSYTSKKIEAYEEQQRVVQSMAEVEVNMTKERSAELVKAAEESRDQMIAVAQGKYQQLIAEAEQMYAAGTIEKDAYEQMRQNALSSFNEQKMEAEKTFADTNAIISEKLFDQQVLTSDSVMHWKDYFAALEMAESDYQEQINFIRQQEREGFKTHQDAEAAISNLSEKVAEDRKNLLRQMVAEGADAWDEDTQNMVSYWMTMAANTEMYGGQVTDKEKAFVVEFGEIMDVLPDHMKGAAKDSMQGFLGEVKAETPSILNAAQNMAGGFLNTIKGIFDIHSPSRKMRDIAKNVWKGWELQSDRSRKGLIDQVSSIAGKINDSFQNEIDLDSGIADLADRGRQIANAVEQRINANINPARQEILVSMPQGNAGTTLNQTNNFYSPEALSPAETARLNRNNVRNTIRMLRS